MAKSFGDRDKDAGKRPAPTIEGTATEVAVEPEVETTAEMNKAPDDEPGVETKPEQAASDEATEGSKRIEFGPPPPERAPRLNGYPARPRTAASPRPAAEASEHPGGLRPRAASWPNH